MPGSMYDFLYSSCNIDSANFRPLVECRIPTSVRPEVILGFVVVTFTCGDLGFRCFTFDHVSGMYVLSWFGDLYFILHNWYNLYSLLPVNVFSPSSFQLGFQLLLSWFFPVWFDLVALN